MKKNKIQSDKTLNFNVKVPLSEIKESLNSKIIVNLTKSDKSLRDIYFEEAESILDVKKYLNSEGDLAVNVKWYHPYLNDQIYHEDTDISPELLTEMIIDTFWYKANQIAINYGYAACYSFGRSNGWALPMMKNENNYQKTKALKYHNDQNELEYLAQLKVFSMFAKDIENLFTLIHREIRDVKSINELTKLQNRIYDL